MNILIANDDGIQAEGIRHLAEALSEKGNVYVVAPDTQRSASSHALSIHGRMRAEEVPDFPGAKQAWKLSGTPADCVKLGVEILRRKGIETDIVYAGINHGANLGSDTMYSGTVSAAAEGMFAGYPAVAVSVCSHFPKYFEAACSLAVKVFDRALETAGKGYLISINTPNLPQEEIKGVRTARLGQMTYDEW
ncbi:MAG: 5'/3'-nucleotidase SurE, partial [Anaerovoracaceae bacterium]